MRPELRLRVRAAAGAAALAVAVATLSPLAPAHSDDRSLAREAARAQDRTFHRPDADVQIDPQARPSALAGLPKVKGWTAPKAVFSTYNGFQSYDIARNAKGQSVVAWAEVGSGSTVRIRYARLTPANKVLKRVKLTGWITRDTVDSGIVGQVAATIDKDGNATVVWTQRTGEATGVRAASIGAKGRTTTRWVTQQGHPPMSVFAKASATGHVVVWWNGYDPEAWGSPQQYVLWKGRKAFTKVNYTRDPDWMPDEGGTASVSNTGLVSATWVERGSGQGRLRAVTLDKTGKLVEKVPATASNLIMNSSHATTASGNLTVSYMDQEYVDEWRTHWYTLRRTNGTWSAPKEVTQLQPYGYTWSIAGNDTGKAATIGLGYGPGNPPESIAVTAGVQAKPGARWTVTEAGPRVYNGFSFFTPRVHMTANGRTVTSYRGSTRPGVAWTKKGTNGTWVRSGVGTQGDLAFASDARSRVNMLSLASYKGFTLTVYQNDL
ncbi:MAG: hypothetical protein ACI379_08575 [Nocardioides sp.]|uniref:hypothetical protein n=1 Tax=Nocardioides sp. TaxID=35761 RepID=UPI003F077F0A